MESPELGCGREGTAGPSASLGMTKFRWLADLGTSYSDGGVLSLVAAERELQVPVRLRSGQALGFAPNDKPETGALSAAYPTQAKERLEWGTPTFVAGTGGRVIALLTCHRQVGSSG
jgi:hypothetical protein